MSEVVHFKGVSKRYHRGRERSNLRALVPGKWGEITRGDSFHALDDVTFDLSDGESLGVVGENGAGKSTLLKLLAGVMRPTSGTIEVKGRVASVIELGVGFNPDMSGRENVEFGGSLIGLSPAQLRARYDDIVAFAGIEEFMDTPVKRYSTGMQARLGFALVSSVDADVYAFDEVLAVGDWRFQRACFERIRNLHRDGAAMLLVAHNHWALAQLCDSMLLLEHGRVTANGTPNDVINRYLGDEFVSELDPDVDLPVAPVLGEAPEERGVYIEGLELLPGAIEPGGRLRFRFRLRVEVPVEAELVMSIFTYGRAIYAEREEGPSHLLGEVGTWEVVGTVDRVPLAAGAFEVRVAVLTDPDKDQDQDFPSAIAKASAPLTILGSLSRRPGFKFDTEWSTTSVPPIASGSPDSTP